MPKKPNQPRCPLHGAGAGPAAEPGDEPMIDLPLLRTDLIARERARHQAVVDLRLNDAVLSKSAIEVLLHISVMDRENPLGPAWNLNIDEISKPVFLEDLPEPWATRAFIWGGSRDWDQFRCDWWHEHDARMEGEIDERAGELERRLLDAEQAESSAYLWNVENQVAIRVWSCMKIMSEIKGPLRDFSEWKSRQDDKRITNLYSVCLDSREYARCRCIDDLKNPVLREKAVALLARIANYDSVNPITPDGTLTTQELRRRLERSGAEIDTSFICRAWVERFLYWYQDDIYPEMPTHVFLRFLGEWEKNEALVSRLLDSTNVEHLRMSR